MPSEYNKFVKKHFASVHGTGLSRQRQFPRSQRCGERSRGVRDQVRANRPFTADAPPRRSRRATRKSASARRTRRELGAAGPPVTEKADKY